MNLIGLGILAYAGSQIYKKIKKKTVYLKIRHKPFLMYFYLLIPHKLKTLVGKVFKKSGKKKGKGDKNYINKEDIDTLIMVDTRSKKRLQDFAKVLDRPDIKVIVYDHHDNADDKYKCKQ